jgi:hypothetical protein
MADSKADVKGPVVPDRVLTCRWDAAFAASLVLSDEDRRTMNERFEWIKKQLQARIATRTSSHDAVPIELGGSVAKGTAVRGPLSEIDMDIVVLFPNWDPFDGRAFEAKLDLLHSILTLKPSPGLWSGQLPPIDGVYDVARKKRLITFKFRLEGTASSVDLLIGTPLSREDTTFLMEVKDSAARKRWSASVSPLQVKSVSGFSARRSFAWPNGGATN